MNTKALILLVLSQQSLLIFQGFSKSQRPIGASTITQQVARNFLLPNIARKVSLVRKLKEAILAFRIEKTFTKAHIMELYLNEIYLGAGSYGVAAAALSYFNKSLNELTIGEMAFLAGLPKAPNRYHPLKSPELALGRRNYVLKRMHEDKFITYELVEHEINKPIIPKMHGKRNIVKADYFAQEVRQELIQKYGEQVLYKDGMTVRTTLDPALQHIALQSLRLGLINYDRRHGWRGPLGNLNLKQPSNHNDEPSWYTALKRFKLPAYRESWQGAVVLDLKSTHALIGLENGRLGSIALSDLKWARRYLTINTLGPIIKSPEDVLNIGDVILVEDLQNSANNYRLCQVPEISGGILAMDPHTGRVLAMQGGFSFKVSQFNRATQALRQTGSVFKTFVYLKAFEQGLSPSMQIDDSAIAIDLLDNQGVWSPHNYRVDFNGSTSLRRAFERSLNTVTARLAHDYIGINNILEIAQRFEIIDNKLVYPSMVLGSNETTLLKMVRAMAMIANGGHYISPTFIDRVQDRYGKTVISNTSVTCSDLRHSPLLAPYIYNRYLQVTDAVSAYQMISLLEGVVKRGTGRALADLGLPIAGKSGTTNDFKDAWFIAFTPDLIIGTYIGFDQPRSMGKHENGGNLAAAVVREFLREILNLQVVSSLRKISPKPFFVPPGVKLVRVDPSTGQPVTDGNKTAIWEAFRASSYLPNKSISNTNQPSLDHESPELQGLY